MCRADLNRETEDSPVIWASPMGQVPWGATWRPSTNGDGEKPPKLTERLSPMFLRPAKPKEAPPEEPDRVLGPEERKAAMSGLSAVEVKWAKGGLILATGLGIVLTLYLSSAHRTRTETIIRHGKKIKGIGARSRTPGCCWAPSSWRSAGSASSPCGGGSAPWWSSRSS